MSTTSATVKSAPRPITRKVASVPTAAPSFVRQFTKETMQALDEKYDKPELMGGFNIYFGKKYKEASFADAAADESYTRYIMSLEPKTSCMYLFHRFIKAAHPDICQ